MAVNIALAQINSTVGDLVGNATKIIEVVKRAYKEGAHIVVTPELSLVGYPPEDLLLRTSFYDESEKALAYLALRLEEYKNIRVIVGHPLMRDGQYFNAASLLLNGQVVGTYAKYALPNNAVFDEKRYFASDDKAFVFTCNDLCIGINICEDTWDVNAPLSARAAGAQVLLVLNASPYHIDKQQERLAMMRANVSAHGMALVYVNLVGGQDELVFDGNSFVLDNKGNLCVQLSHVEEDMRIVIFDDGAPCSQLCAPLPSLEEQIYTALVLGVRDYVGKNNFSSVLIGLSGGVDSALTLAIAVDALGADKVHAVMMPSVYTAEISKLDSREIVERLGVRYDEIMITECFDAFCNALAPQFAGLANDTTEENLQARIRGTMLMALSNKHGALVLTTGNKSEMAVGYCTLYGDMAGGFAVIKDVVKTQVYRLCAYRNSVSDVIPDRILTRAPSAELRADQTDQDALPLYEVVDAIIKMYVEQNKSIQNIIDAGYIKQDVMLVTRLIKLNEYKRRQAPIGIRITERAFGRDWRYPVTSKFLA